MTDYTTPPPPPPPPPVGPPSGPPMGGPPMGGDPYGGVPQQPQNLFGLLALIFGIVSLVLCCLWAGVWAGIPAIVLGVLGLQKANKGLATNKPFAIAGIALGAVALLITIIAAIAGASIDPSQFQS